MVQQRISNNNFLVLKLKSGLVRALLNTGSVVSLVSERFAKQHGLAVSPIRDHEYSFLISASGLVNLKTPYGLCRMVRHTSFVSSFVSGDSV